ncbi:MAG: cell division protein FtsA, partial [Chloroflexi bacterium]|nr:cell division protein FtsA [Chloroflexota bacterium]
AGHKIISVYAGIAGDHIRSINSKGVIAVSSKDKIITEEDVARVIDAAKAIALPMDREILHILPQEYVVDEQDGIKNPVGMAGTRLEAEVHIVTAAAASAQNIINCIHEAGYEVADIVLEPYASSLAVLDTDERELGVAIIDIGGGTTDIAMIFDGSVRFTSVLGLGGQHLTSDISQGLRTSADLAEEIKKNYGVAMQSLIETDELIKVA